ncbi:MAG: hypothetical protein ABFS32_21260 [Bacteroidota bacterium]
MKKIFSVMFVFFLASCQGYESIPLGNDYYLSDSDRNHIYIYKKMDDKEGFNIVVEQHVLDFQVIRGYLLVLRGVASSLDCYDQNNIPTIITHYSDKREYWVINMKVGNIKGPLDKPNYLHIKNELGFGNVELKSKYHIQSNTKSFNKLISECSKIKWH